MNKKLRFGSGQLALLRKARGIRIRAGTASHRFIGIWNVMIGDRVFVRSWSVKADGWYRAFLHDPRGKIHVSKMEIAIRALPARSKSLRDAVDLAYLEKYNTAGAIKYARDLGTAKSRATTLELVPRQVRGAAKT
jgi:hypothetical protein